MMKIRSGWGVVSAFALVIAILLAPIMLVDMPPLLDYPIHLARSYITLHYATDSDLSSIYQIDWRPIPNLAIDLSLLFLGQIMDVEVAGRVFLGACLVLTVAGVATLHRVIFERWSYWPLIAAIPAYHGALMAGFVNFSMGLAIVSFGLAAWIALRDHAFSLRLGVHSLFVLILYFCHVLSLGLFGIVLGAYTLWRIGSMPRSRTLALRLFSEALLLGTPFLIAAWFYLRHSFAEVITRDEKILYGAWQFGPKIRGLMMPVLTHNLILDCLSLLILVSIPLALVFYRRLKVAYGLVLGVAIIAGLFLILPGNLLDAGFIMERLLIAAVLIGIAATQPYNLTPRTGGLIAAIVLGLVLSRSAVLTTNWIESEDYYQRSQAMANAVERGSSVLIVSPFSDPEVKSMRLWQHRFQGYPDWHYALINIPNLHSLPIMPLTRRATFAQLHFLQSDKQVLSLKPAYQGITEGDGGSATVSPNTIFRTNNDDGSFTVTSVSDFDYILILYLDHVHPELLEKIQEHRSLYTDQDMVLLDVEALSEATSQDIGHLTPLSLPLPNDRGVGE